MEGCACDSHFMHLFLPLGTKLDGEIQKGSLGVPAIHKEIWRTGLQDAELFCHSYSRAEKVNLWVTV